jgi:hypothetical protein
MDVPYLTLRIQYGVNIVRIYLFMVAIEYSRLASTGNRQVRCFRRQQLSFLSSGVLNCHYMQTPCTEVFAVKNTRSRSYFWLLQGRNSSAENLHYKYFLVILTSTCGSRLVSKESKGRERGNHQCMAVIFFRSRVGGGQTGATAGGRSRC